METYMDAVDGKHNDGVEITLSTKPLIKSRLKDDFLLVFVGDDDTKYLCWFNSWTSIDADSLKKLNESNQSLLTIEASDGTNKKYLVPDRKIMDVWLTNKSNKNARNILIEHAVLFHNSLVENKKPLLNRKQMKVVSLTCSCCGSDAKGRQWHNRDLGYGLCVKCADWMIGRGESKEDMQRNYGSNGIHWIDSNSDFL